jgi:hypothetical protein
MIQIAGEDDKYHSSLTHHFHSFSLINHSIFNLLGEKVKEEKVTGRQVMMDVSSLLQGLYLVRMENKMVGKFGKE